MTSFIVKIHNIIKNRVTNVVIKNRNIESIMATKKAFYPYVFTYSNNQSYVGLKLGDDRCVVKKVSTKEMVVDRVIKNILCINKKYSLVDASCVDIEKVRFFLGKIKGVGRDILKKPLEDNDKSIESKDQEGGFLIYMAENAIIKYAGWSWLTYGFIGLLEIIDIALGVAAAIPGLQAVAGAGFIIDALSIAYAFLRLDWYGVFGGIISIVPLVGDIGGGLLDGTGIYRRITKYARKAKMSKAFKRVKQAKQFSDDYGEYFYDNDNDSPYYDDSPYYER